MKRKLLLFSLVACTLFGTGCAKRLVFATQTSLGLDVSGTAQVPNKVSFSYNRFEGAIVPRKTNGEAHSVFGGMDADINFFDSHTIKQTFATGKAAMIATGADEPTNEKPTVLATTNDHPLVFLTATTFGLHLTAGEGQAAPNMLLGYRRSEAVTIPVPDPAVEVRSVYADILINSSKQTNATAITTNFSSLKGVLIKQSFATGRAAEALARNSSEIKSKLETAAGADVARDIMARNHQRAVLVAEDIGKELDRYRNDQLDEVIDKFKDAGVISSTIATDWKSETDARKKSIEMKNKAKENAKPNQLPTLEVEKLEKLLGLLRTIK
jgi:hypothetical protein